jgi:hypothetical protein
MATLQTKAIQPSTGSNVNLGTSGDAVLLNSDSIQTNLYKDAGGNTLFQSDGAGTLSNVNSGMIGAGPKLIQSQTASGTTTIDFTTGIDSTYDKYMFVLINMSCSGNDASMGFQANAVGASGFNETITSTHFAALHTESDSSAYLAYNTSADQAQGTGYQIMQWEQGGGASYPDMCISGILYLYAPSSTTYVKQFYSTFSSVNVSNGPTVPAALNSFCGGYINSALAMDEISFKYSAGNIDAGTIKLYGIA